MSTNYFMYTEVLMTGKWQCINARIPNKEGFLKLTETYWSGSRTYFSETAQKLKELGTVINKEELSPEVRDLWKNYSFDIYAIDIKSINKNVPSLTEKEKHGFVLKDDIFSYERDELEDIYDYIGPKEYNSLDNKAKQTYQYYEWDDPYGWFKNFKNILEHVSWQTYAYDTVNFSTEFDAVRLVLFIS